MIVYGMRHYGKVDAIPGLGYVKTRFVHIWYVPLVPLGSVFVVSEEDDGVQGLKVPLNGRSVISTWARTWVVLSTIGMLAAMGFAAVGLGGVLLEGNGINKSTVSGALLSIGMGGGACFGLVFNIAVWWGIGRFWSMANPSRAAAMMEKLGMQPKAPEIEHYDDPFIDDAQSIE